MFAFGVMTILLLFLLGTLLRQMNKHAQVNASANRELAREIGERWKIVAELRKTHDRAALHVQQQTAELTALNTQLSLDVMECKQAEQQLRAERDFAMQVMTTMGQGLVVVGADYCIEYVNPAVLQMSGYQQEEVIGKATMAFLPLEDESSALQMRERLRRGERVTFEVCIRHADGRSVPVSVTAAARWLEGQAMGNILVLSDLTERKRAEQELQASEERYRMVSQSISDYVFCCRIDENGEIVLEWLTESVAQVIGYTVAELMAVRNPRAVYIHPDDIDRVTRMMRKLEPSESITYEVRIIRKDGVIRWLQSQAQAQWGGSPQGKLLRVYGAARDITEQKHVADLMRAQVRQQTGLATLGELALANLPLATLFDNAVDLVTRGLELEYCKVLELLPNCQALLLRSGSGWKEGMVGQTTVGIGSDSQAGYTLQSEAPVVVDDLRRETRFTGSPFLSEHGVISGLSVIIGSKAHPFGVLGAHTRQRRTFTEQDIAFLQAVANLLAQAIARMDAERHLRVSEEQYRGLFRSNPLPMWVFDEATLAFLDVNEAAIQHYGYSREEFLAMTILHIRPPEEISPAHTHVAQMENETYHRSPRLSRHQKKSGEVIQVELVAYRLSFHERIAWLVLGNDVTERKRLYFQLQQAYEDLRLTQQAVLQQERLHAVGQMASGIAHDINNAISPAVLYVDSLLISEGGVSTEAREDLALVKQTLGDVTQTVARLRTFYRKTEDEIERGPVDLNAMVQTALELTRARWRDLPQQHGTSITVHPLLEAALPMVLGIESELRQALINLIFNAIDAMPNGGTLTLRTQTTPTAVLLTVIDTGIGMDEATRQHCLEPFFTTKGERGTGLGLAMVYGILQRHAAHIAITSVIGHGTTIQLTFPLPASIREQGSPIGIAAEVAPPSLRILMVDDDPMVRKSLGDILRREGHDVVAADGGEAGIATFLTAQEAHPFAVVITDLGMPKIDGREVARRVKSTAPATFVVLLTGWGRQMRDDGEVPPHVDCLLSKPPSIGELRKTLASASSQLTGE